MAAGFSLARLEDIGEIDDGSVVFRAVRAHFGITTFGVNAMVASAAGDRLINEHAEDEPNSSEELYVVISGRATFELDGESHDAPTGTFVHVAAGTRRTASALEPRTVVLAIGGGPEGQPFIATGWELFAPLFPLFESGEYEQGAERSRELLANGPPHGALYYNTACFEARAGQTDLALEHLRSAVALAPHLGEMAREDEDFASLRELPVFREIVD
jgi:mannose-6-phosphate isomerase-like protein (cupin superfamily)